MKCFAVVKRIDLHTTIVEAWVLRKDAEKRVAELNDHGPYFSIFFSVHEFILLGHVCQGALEMCGPKDLKEREG